MRFALRVVSLLAIAACGGSQPAATPSSSPSTSPAPAPPAASSSSEPSSPAAPADAKDKPGMQWSAAPMSLAQSGIVPDWIDTAADPCTDFYAFACGGFLRTATIPPDRSSLGAIEIVVKDAEDFLHQILEDAARKTSGDPTLDKIGTYYAACMDEAAIERA